MRKITLSQKTARNRLGASVATSFHSLVRDMVDADNFSEVPTAPSSINELNGIKLVYDLGATISLEVAPRMHHKADFAPWLEAHRFCLLRIVIDNRVIA